MKIAVIGSGISGLSAALILKQQFNVELFESEKRLGGHAHTVDVSNSTQQSVPIDTGFLVFNEPTYPHFVGLLKYLNVEVVDSDMSLSIQTHKGLQWAGTNLFTVFAQKRNLFNPKFVKMLFEIVKFNKQAHENLKLAKENNWSLRDLIAFRKNSESFVNWYLLPMTGAIWSMSNRDCLDFPAETFLQFCINHNLLQVEGRPVWKTIKNGSITYVNKIKEQLPVIHTDCHIDKITPVGNKIRISSQSKDYDFDKVILATSAPISYGLLAANFSNWENLLRESKISKNRVVLHKDEGVMPKIKKCWTSWNVMAKGSAEDKSSVELSYYSNKLQPINTKEDYFITLNSERSLNKIEREFMYNHPVFDGELYTIQKKLHNFQGEDGIYLTGAWTRYGFHEDGILSAVNVAKMLGVEPPWKV
ncbi:MAG: FAD-dependent oxidoreductase [Bdellovibrionaceae bacterium]|nr:FAD-dependent oxidoreductase [Pseudobdellovibrionaceae bacterium]